MLIKLFQAQVFTIQTWKKNNYIENQLSPSGVEPLTSKSKREYADQCAMPLGTKLLQNFILIYGILSTAQFAIRDNEDK